MVVTVSANVYVYADEGSGIDADQYAKKMSEDLDAQYNGNGFKANGATVKFNFNVVSVKDVQGAKKKYGELTSHTTKGGTKVSNDLAANENFVILGNDSHTSKAFGNFAFINVNGRQGVEAHEMAHLMGYMYKNTYIEGFNEKWEGHPEDQTSLDNHYNGIMSHKDNRCVTQDDINGLNFGYGLMGEAPLGDDNRDFSQRRERLKNGRKSVGNNTSGVIKGPFETVDQAERIIEKYNHEKK